MTPCRMIGSNAVVLLDSDFFAHGNDFCGAGWYPAADWQYRPIYNRRQVINLPHNRNKLRLRRVVGQPIQVAEPLSRRLKAGCRQDCLLHKN